jgi:hypothetical protein
MIQSIIGTSFKKSELEPALRLTFNDISNANILVGDSSNVEDWNIFFDLPTYGSSFTSVTIVGNKVKLFGGSGIHLKDSLFSNNTSLVEVNDSTNCVITAGSYCFYSCTSLLRVSLPELTTADNNCFSTCTSLTSIFLPLLTTALGFCFASCYSLRKINLPSCTNLGGESGYYYVFYLISNNIITLTITETLMTCNFGTPDGDIEYLQANNTVTIIQV